MSRAGAPEPRRRLFRGSALQIGAARREDDAMAAQAALWVLRLQDGAAPPMGAEDWRALTDWLERDETHRAALEAAEDALAAVDQRSAELRLALRPTPLRSSRRTWSFGLAAAAVAASVAAVLVLAPWRESAIAASYRAGDDAPLRVALADGSTVVLNRGSAMRVVLSRRARRVALEPGSEALFDVAHQSDRLFRVAVDAATVQVLGTRFDVDDRAGAVRVAVSRGAVALSPGGGASPVRVAQGQTALRGAAGQVEIGATPGDVVGAWSTGQLVYRDAPMTQVAADLVRYLGPVRVERSAAAVRFTGVLAIGAPAAMTRDLEAIAPVRLQRSAQGYVVRQRAAA